MKAIELRIGNYVEWSGNKHKVNSLSFGSSYVHLGKKNMEWVAVPFKSVKPMPLTEQWLIDFGFEYDSDSLTYDLGNFIVNNDFENEPTFTIDLYCTGDELILSSVHKLQNLYFALTNEELTLN